jgi:hypothetical protein
MNVTRSRSLLWEIQSLLERTYATTGINLEEFLIGGQRCRELAAFGGCQELSPTGCVFLRVARGKLFMAVHYAPSVIETLERFDPRRGLTEANIRPFAVFVEEINHAVHAALRFLEEGRVAESEMAVRDLELQSRVDCYLVLQLFMARFRRPRRIETAETRWLRHHLFAREHFNYASAALRDRYNEVNFLGGTYAKTLDSLSPPQRVAEIRSFRPLTYAEKRARILSQRKP